MGRLSVVKGTLHSIIIRLTFYFIRAVQGCEHEFLCSPSFDIDDLPSFRVTDIFCKFDRITLEFSEDYLSFVIYEDCSSPDIPQVLAGL